MRAPLGSIKILLRGFLFVVGIYKKWYNIIKQGSHEELINMDGRYAYLFNLQAQKYL